MSSARSYLTYESAKTGRTRSGKGNTNKHWEFMFQGIRNITLAVRKIFPEGWNGIAKSDYSEITRQALKIMRLLR